MHGGKRPYTNIELRQMSPDEIFILILYNGIEHEMLIMLRNISLTTFITPGGFVLVLFGQPAFASRF